MITVRIIGSLINIILISRASTYVFVKSKLTCDICCKFYSDFFLFQKLKSWKRVIWWPLHIACSLEKELILTTVIFVHYLLFQDKYCSARKSIHITEVYLKKNLKLFWLLKNGQKLRFIFNIRSEINIFYTCI